MSPNLHPGPLYPYARLCHIELRAEDSKWDLWACVSGLHCFPFLPRDSQVFVSFRPVHLVMWGLRSCGVGAWDQTHFPLSEN